MPVLAMHNLCTGCSSCVNACNLSCLIMETDEYGFPFPKMVAEKNCVNCGICEQKCPILKPMENNEKRETNCYAAYSKDISLREHSSSGGIFFEIAGHVISQNGIVCGAAYLENYSVGHIFVESEFELEKLQGAKYVQSDLSDVFKKIKKYLDLNILLLFVGTPCQVAGLKSYLGKEYRNLILVDFICHGIPSPNAWRSYVKYRSNIDNSGILPKSINLRDKHSGWSNYKYSNTYNYDDGKQFTQLSGDNLYMKLFVGDYINRESCASCCFKGEKRISDFTISDFWGIWNLRPDFDDDKGVSGVLVHSEKAQSIWNLISSRLTMTEVNIEDIKRENPALYKSYPMNPNRLEALIKSISGDFDYLAEHFFALTNNATETNHGVLSRIKKIVKRLVSLDRS